MRREARRYPPRGNDPRRRGALQARDEGRDRSDRQAPHRLIPPVPDRHCFSGDPLMSPVAQLHAKISGPVVMIGFGSIGRGTLPLIERHFEYDKSRFVVIDPSDKNKFLLDERGIKLIQTGLTKANYREILTPLLTAGGGQGFCVNVSVDTSSLDIMKLCR